MGQGAESAGGYEAEYDPYEDGLATGTWTQKSGASINIANMTTRHLRCAKDVAEKAQMRATFSCDADMWAEWVILFDHELLHRKFSDVTKTKKSTEPAKPVRGMKTLMRCYCGREYEARDTDLKRGWGMSCSKRCASIRREYGRPAAKKVDKV